MYVFVNIYAQVEHKNILLWGEYYIEFQYLLAVGGLREEIF